MPAGADGVEAALVVAGDDDLVPVGQAAEEVVEGEHLLAAAELGEVAGVDEDVAVGDGVLELVELGVGVGHADHSDLK